MSRVSRGSMLRPYALAGPTTTPSTPRAGNVQAPPGAWGIRGERRPAQPPATKGGHRRPRGRTALTLGRPRRRYAEVGQLHRNATALAHFAARAGAAVVSLCERD